MHKMHQMVHKRFAYVQSVAEINVAITMHEEMCQNWTWNICRDMPQTGYEIQLIGCYTADDTTDESLSTVSFSSKVSHQSKRTLLW